MRRLLCVALLAVACGDDGGRAAEGDDARTGGRIATPPSQRFDAAPEKVPTDEIALKVFGMT